MTYQKTFFDIGDFPELSQWLTTVFVPVFYQTSWYNGDPYSATETGFVRRYMQIIQGARIRQARVTNTSCSLEQRTVAYAQRFKPPGGGCYGEYVFGDSSDVKPFGPPGDPARYRYYAPLASSVEGLAGYGVTDYGNGGYVVYLPTDATNGTAVSGAGRKSAAASSHLFCAAPFTPFLCRSVSFSTSPAAPCSSSTSC